MNKISLDAYCYFLVLLFGVILFILSISLHCDSYNKCTVIFKDVVSVRYGLGTSIQFFKIY